MPQFTAQERELIKKRIAQLEELKKQEEEFAKLKAPQTAYAKQVMSGALPTPEHIDESEGALSDVEQRRQQQVEYAKAVREGRVDPGIADEPALPVPGAGPTVTAGSVEDAVVNAEGYRKQREAREAIQAASDAENRRIRLKLEAELANEQRAKDEMSDKEARVIPEMRRQLTHGMGTGVAGALGGLGYLGEKVGLGRGLTDKAVDLQEGIDEIAGPKFASQDEAEALGLKRLSRAQQFGAGLTETGASVIPYMASGGPLGAAALGALQSGGDAAIEADQAGVSQAIRDKHVLGSMAVGTLEGASYAIPGPMKLPGMKALTSKLPGGIVGAGLKAAGGSVQEGAQEGLSQAGSNLVAKYSGFDPERKVTEGVVEATAGGALIGNALGTLQAARAAGASRKQYKALEKTVPEIAEAKRVLGISKVTSQAQREKVIGVAELFIKQNQGGYGRPAQQPAPAAGAAPLDAQVVPGPEALTGAPTAPTGDVDTGDVDTGDVDRTVRARAKAEVDAAKVPQGGTPRPEPNTTAVVSPDPGYGQDRIPQLPKNEVVEQNDRVAESIGVDPNAVARGRTTRKAKKPVRATRKALLEERLSGTIAKLKEQEVDLDDPETWEWLGMAAVGLDTTASSQPEGKEAAALGKEITGWAGLKDLGVKTKADRDQLLNYVYEKLQPQAEQKGYTSTNESPYLTLPSLAEVIGPEYASPEVQTQLREHLNQLLEQQGLSLKKEYTEYDKETKSQVEIPLDIPDLVITAVKSRIAPILDDLGLNTDYIERKTATGKATAKKRGQAAPRKQAGWSQFALPRLGAVETAAATMDALVLMADRVRYASESTTGGVPLEVGGETKTPTVDTRKLLSDSLLSAAMDLGEQVGIPLKAQGGKPQLQGFLGRGAQPYGFESEQKLNAQDPADIVADRESQEIDERRQAFLQTLQKELAKTVGGESAESDAQAILNVITPSPPKQVLGKGGAYSDIGAGLPSDPSRGGVEPLGSQGYEGSQRAGDREAEIAGKIEQLQSYDPRAKLEEKVDYYVDEYSNNPTPTNFQKLEQILNMADRLAKREDLQKKQEKEAAEIQERRAKIQKTSAKLDETPVVGAKTEKVAAPKSTDADVDLDLSQEEDTVETADETQESEVASELSETSEETEQKQEIRKSVEDISSVIEDAGGDAEAILRYYASPELGTPKEALDQLAKKYKVDLSKKSEADQGEQAAPLEQPKNLGAAGTPKTFTDFTQTQDARFWNKQQTYRQKANKIFRKWMESSPDAGDVVGRNIKENAQDLANFLEKATPDVKDLRDFANALLDGASFGGKADFDFGADVAHIEGLGSIYQAARVASQLADRLDGTVDPVIATKLGKLASDASAILNANRKNMTPTQLVTWVKNQMPPNVDADVVKFFKERWSKNRMLRRDFIENLGHQADFAGATWDVGDVNFHALLKKHPQLADVIWTDYSAKFPAVSTKLLAKTGAKVKTKRAKQSMQLLSESYVTGMYTAMLSAPGTHKVNMVGNMVNAAYLDVQDFFRNALDIVDHKISGVPREQYQKSFRTVQIFREMANKETHKAAWRAFRTGMSLASIGHHTQSGKAIDVGKSHRSFSPLSLTAMVAGSPGRLLVAADAYFKIAALKVHLKNRGISGKGLDMSDANLVKYMEDGTWDEAIRFAEESTFERSGRYKGETYAAQLGGKASQVLGMLPNPVRVNLVPFARIATNIGSRGIDVLPVVGELNNLGFVEARGKRAFVKDMVAMRMAQLTSAASVLGAMAALGIEWEDDEIDNIDGWAKGTVDPTAGMPGSIKVNGTKVQVSRDLGPVGVMVNVMNRLSKGQPVDAVRSGAANILNLPFVSGSTEKVEELMSDYKSPKEKFVGVLEDASLPLHPVDQKWVEKELGVDIKLPYDYEIKARWAGSRAIVMAATGEYQSTKGEPRFTPLEGVVPALGAKEGLWYLPLVGINVKGTQRGEDIPQYLHDMNKDLYQKLYDMPYGTTKESERRPLKTAMAQNQLRSEVRKLSEAGADAAQLAEFVTAYGDFLKTKTSDREYKDTEMEKKWFTAVKKIAKAKAIRSLNPRLKKALQK